MIELSKSKCYLPATVLPRRISLIVLLLASTVFFSNPVNAVETNVEMDRSPSALKARLQRAEDAYKAGDINAAIEAANSLTNVVDSSIFRSDSTARDAKADLVIFNIKAGHPDISARFVRELLLSVQLEMPMAPGFDKDAAATFATAPTILREYFNKVMDRLGANDGDTKAIVDSLISNTYPKNYAARLKSFSKRVQFVLAELEPLKASAEREELRYTDRVTDPADTASDTTQHHLSKAKLSQLGSTLQDLSKEAQFMPVGDMRPAIGLYQLALLANSQKDYAEAADFVEWSERHVKAFMTDSPIIPNLQIARAFAEQKGYTPEFKSMRDDILKRNNLSP